MVSWRDSGLVQDSDDEDALSSFSTHASSAASQVNAELHEAEHEVTAYAATYSVIHKLNIVSQTTQILL